MKSKRVNPQTSFFFQANPSQAISKSLLVLKIPEISRNNKSCNAEFDLVTSSSGSNTHFYISSTKSSTQPAYRNIRRTGYHLQI